VHARAPFGQQEHKAKAQHAQDVEEQLLLDGAVEALERPDFLVMGVGDGGCWVQRLASRMETAADGLLQRQSGRAARATQRAATMANRQGRSQYAAAAHDAREHLDDNCDNYHVYMTM